MRAWREQFVAGLCLLPAAVLVGGIIFYPILRTLVASLCEVDALGHPGRFGTLANYRALVEDQVFRRDIVPQTLLWTGGIVVPTLLISLFVALVLNERFRFRRLVRGILMLPWATSLVISAAIWKWLLHPTQGPLNRTLELLGLVQVGREPAWLAQPSLALPTVIAVGIWVSIPFTSVVLLAGLQSIPDDLHEAAALDGAVGWQRLRHVTLPLLRPVFLVAVLLNVIYVFNSFPIIWTLTEGGPTNQTHILVTYLYRQAILQRQYGPGNAMAVVTFGVLLAFALLYTRIAMREGPVET
jgi:multiple sugar transport system permease protein